MFVNRKVAEWLGHHDAEMVKGAGDPLLRLMHPADQVLFGAHMARVIGLSDGQIADFVYRMRHAACGMRHADGSWRWPSPEAHHPAGAITLTGSSCGDSMSRLRPDDLAA